MHHMHHRAKALAFGFLVASVSAAIVTTSACTDNCPPGSVGWGEFEVIQHGSAADLYDIVPASPGYSMAVGSNGTVLTLKLDLHDDLQVDVSTIEPGVTLRGAADFYGVWWVVGDNGLAAFSSDQGQTWTKLDLATSASLHAIAPASGDGFLVIVGDEVVRLIGDAATWTEILPPSEGWGQLRAVSHVEGVEGEGTYAVGLDGVIRATDDVTKSWHAESSGVNADLFAVGRSSQTGEINAVGADGTHLARQDGTWVDIGADTPTDLIDYDRGAVLTEEGNVEGVDVGAYESFVGARALRYDGVSIVVIGDAGLIARNADRLCY
jgi:hypothetical protein